jgi:hypothetical protein
MSVLREISPVWVSEGRLEQSAVTVEAVAQGGRDVLVRSTQPDRADLV